MSQSYCPDSEARRCNECGASLRDRGRNARFCGTPCKTKFNNRRVARGGIVYDLAMRWRAKRGKEDLSDLCHQIGIFLNCDRDDGRQSWNDYTGQAVPWQIPLDVSPPDAE